MSLFITTSIGPGLIQTSGEKFPWEQDGKDIACVSDVEPANVLIYSTPIKECMLCVKLKREYMNDAKL